MNTPQRLTTKTGRNQIIAWVAVIQENGRELNSVHLPYSISEEDMLTAERQILSLVNSVANSSYTKGVSDVRSDVKSALGLP